MARCAVPGPGPVTMPTSCPVGVLAARRRAVASRVCLGATGTDTGGSIRQPAAFTGIVGMKPTYGRCSRWGTVAFASSLDQAGPMTRSGRGCGADAAGDGRLRCQGQHQREPGGAGLARKAQWRSQGDAHRHPGPSTESTACRRRSKNSGIRALAWLKEAGAELIDINLPHTKYALPAYYIIAPAEASSNLARYDGMRFGLSASRATTLSTPI